jgi:hypothetical protein
VIEIASAPTGRNQTRSRTQGIVLEKMASLIFKLLQESLPNRTGAPEYSLAHISSVFKQERPETPLR